jgi:hypothetical protein
MHEIIRILSIVIFCIFMFAAVFWVYYQIFKPRDEPELPGWQYGEMLDPFDPHSP